MIRTPRSPVQPCDCGACHVCVDPLTLAWAADVAERRTRWRTADLAGDAAGRMVTITADMAGRLNEPRGTATERFEAHMSALYERLGVGRG